MGDLNEHKVYKACLGASQTAERDDVTNFSFRCSKAVTRYGLDYLMAAKGR
jgi:hypothetical protein